MRKNETPRRAGEHGEGAHQKTATPKYTLRDAAYTLIGCLLLAFAESPETLRQRLAEVEPMLTGITLPNQPQALLNALKQAAEQNLPYDLTTLKHIASAGGLDITSLANLAENAPDASYALHYAQ